MAASYIFVLRQRWNFQQPCTRAKSVRRLHPGAPPDPLPAGLTVTEGLVHTPNFFETSLGDFRRRIMKGNKLMKTITSIIYLLFAFVYLALSPPLKAQCPSACGAGGNTGVGDGALDSVSTGINNTAVGKDALTSNTIGTYNVAIGRSALRANVSGNFNMAIGTEALRFNVGGSGNIAIGDEAGTGLGASVNNCIAIGAPGVGPFATFDNTCFIGNIFGENVSDPTTQVP